MVASTTKHMWHHPVFKHKGGLSTTRLIGLIPTVQDQRLNRLAQSSDETIKTFLKKEQIRQAYEKLWIQAAGDKEKMPSIWQLKPVTEVPKYGDEEITSGWQVATPKTSSLKPRNWRKVEFAKWTKRVSQGQLWMGKDHQLLDQELQRYILHRELGTARQVRATFTSQESSWQRVGKKGTSNPAATARLRMKHAPRSSGTAQSCRMQELKGTITSVKCYQRELKRRSG